MGFFAGRSKAGYYSSRQDLSIERISFKGNGIPSENYGHLMCGILGAAKTITKAPTAWVIPIQVSLDLQKNSVASQRMIGANFELKNSIEDTDNVGIKGVLTRIYITKNCGAVYGTQSHIQRDGNAVFTGEMFAGSFKTDVGAGSQLRGEVGAFQAVLTGSAAKWSAQMVGRFQLYADAKANYIVHLQSADRSEASTALYISNHGVLTHGIQMNNCGAGTWTDAFYFPTDAGTVPVANGGLKGDIDAAIKVNYKGAIKYIPLWDEVPAPG